MGIVGFYCSDTCLAGNPYREPGDCKPDKLVVKAPERGMSLINPASDPSEITPLTNLIESGYYTADGAGVVRSVYLPQRAPNLGGRDEFITPFRAGTTSDIRQGRQTSFKQFTGLEESIRIEKNGYPPIYVVDNHHLAFFAWEESRAMQYLAGGALLFHIDAHSDDIIPESRPGFDDLRGAAEYLTHHLDIGNFIWPAVQRKTVQQFWNFGLSFYKGSDIYFYRFPPIGFFMNGSERWQTCGGRNYYQTFLYYPPDGFCRRDILELTENECRRNKCILDIDLDAFLPEVTSSNCREGLDEDEISTISYYVAALAQNMSIITIATSPAFTCQTDAVRAAQRIVEEILSKKK